MKKSTKGASLASLAVIPLLLSGCSAAQADDHLRIFATTGYLADIAKNLAPEAEVITMVGPGGDPHTYEPTTRDIEAMRDADLVLWNGLHLEARMEEQLGSLGDKQLAVGSVLPEQDLLPWEDDLHDPHVWNSPDLWVKAVDAVGHKLSDIDPENDYMDAADSYSHEILAAAHRAEDMLADASPRILITGHDAFNYFGKTFDFDVYATDFVSTEATLSAAELNELADVIARNRVPVIFQDNQANPQAIKALQEAVQDRGWNVEISTEELFADTLGATAPTDTYIGAFTHNAEAVAKALNAQR